MLCIRGKSGKNPKGKFTFPLGLFLAFLGQKPTNDRLPKLMADVAVFYSWSLFAKYGSRVVTTLAQVWGRGAPSVSPAPLFNRRVFWYNQAARKKTGKKTGKKRPARIV